MLNINSHVASGKFLNKHLLSLTEGIYTVIEQTTQYYSMGFKKMAKSNNNYKNI